MVSYEPDVWLSGCCPVADNDSDDSNYDQIAMHDQQRQGTCFRKHFNGMLKTCLVSTR